MGQSGHPDLVTVVFNRPEAEALYESTAELRAGVASLGPATRPKYENTPMMSAVRSLKEAIDRA